MFQRILRTNTVSHPHISTPSYAPPHLHVVHDNHRDAAMQQRILEAGAPAVPRQREAVAGALEQLPILPGGVVSVAVPHVVLLAPTGKCGVEWRFGVKYGHPSTTSLALNVHAQ